MKSDIVIETERLYLRKMTEDDAPELMKLFSDPVVMRYFPGTRNEQETRDWIKRIMARYEKYGYGFNISVNKQTQEVMGYCGLIVQEDVDGKDEVEIGYGLMRKYWGKGFASEAAIGCKKYGFEEMKLERIISIIRPENKPSINVATRNGMKWEKDIFIWGYLCGIYVVTNPGLVQ